MGILRLFLAICVVIVHAPDTPATSFGFHPLQALAAVQTFYIISGFYMAMILHEKYRGPGSYRLFLTNRFLRIFPTYWAVLALAVVFWVISSQVTGKGGPLTIHSFLSARDAFLVTLSNIAIFGQDALMFCGINSHGHLVFTKGVKLEGPPISTFLFVPQAWSLSIELMFYLCAPFIVRRGVKTIAAIILASVALRLFIYLPLHLQKDPWTYRFFPNEMALFLTGSLAYRVYRRIGGYPIPRAWLWSGAVFFAACCLSYQFVPTDVKYCSHLLMWGFYLLAFGAIPIIFTCMKNSRIDRYIGELSYPVYIIHFLVIEIFGVFFHSFKGEPFLIIAASIAISMVLIHLIIAPIERVRQRRVRQPQIAPSRVPVEMANA